MDLLIADDEEPKLTRWKERGDLLALWGPNLLHLCQCKAMELATWFRAALARDKGAEAEFVAFVAGLGK